MTSSYTPNKRLEKPASGDYVNTWATPVNADWDNIDTAFGGLTSINAVGASGTITLTIAQYRPPNIIISGTLTANVTYSLPSGVGGIWTISNATTGAYTVVISSAGGGTSISLPQGYRTLVVCDGTNVSTAFTFPLTAAGSNTQLQFNSSGYLGASSSLTWDGTYFTSSGLKISGSTSGAVGFIAPAIAGSTVYTLPSADGTSGQVLTTNGTGGLSWATGSGGSAGVSSFSGGTTGLTPSTASTGVITLSGTLGAMNGGTGVNSSPTNGQLLIGNGSGYTLAALTAGSNITITNSAGGITIAASTTSLTNWTEAVNTSAPNATVPVVSFTATNAATNVDAAILPKGSGAFALAIADSTATGGNKRGTNAVDLQTSRSNASQVASGASSFVAGSGSTASGNNSAAVGGVNNVASSSYAAVIGGYANTASGYSSIVLGGQNGTTRSAYGLVHGGLTITNAAGVSQFRKIVLGRQTTDATATVLTADTNAAAATNQVNLVNNSAFYFKGTVIANVTGGGNTKGWTIEGVIKRGASAGSTALVGSATVTSSYADAGASTWAVSVTADTTNGCLAITVTGQASTTIRWVASVETTEVTF